MWRRRLLLPLLAWVLWMDQTVYTIPAPGDPTPPQLETAPGRWTQLAVTSTRGECEGLRNARVQAAIQAEAAEDARSGRRARYRDQFRFFCSPAVDDTGK